MKTKTKRRESDESSSQTCCRLVKLRKYCELTGDTPQAVHSRRKRGEWVEGKHFHFPNARRLWIDIEEVSAWVRGQSN